MEKVFLPNSAQHVATTHNMGFKEPPTGNYGAVKIVPVEILVDGKHADSPCGNTTRFQSSCISCFQVLVVSLAIIVAICCTLIFCRKHIKEVLIWMEQLNFAYSCIIYLFLFALVSFPLIWGYLLLIISSGYLFGLLCGACVVLVCASCGILFSHLIMQRACNKRLLDKFYSEKVAAIIRVVESDQGFKVVALARLTPIPFGLQNAIFAMTNVKLPRYCAASVVGLVPMVVLNCYLGTTLRSMTDVFSDGEETSTAYFIFAIQIVLTVGFMVFVVRKAREELSKTVDDANSPSRKVANGSASQSHV